MRLLLLLLTAISLYAQPAGNVCNVSNAQTNGYVLTATTTGGRNCAWQASSAGSGTVTSVGFTGGLISVGTPTTTPAFTVAGTSGGVPYFSSASTWASSGALTAHGVILGGGAGTAPASTAAGTSGQVLTSNGASADPTFQAPSPSACTDYTSSGRVFGTTYQNTTGKPLYISAWGHDSIANQLAGYIDTFTPPTNIRAIIGLPSGGTNGTVFFVVVPNSYYIVDFISGGTKTLLGWYECN